MRATFRNIDADIAACEALYRARGAPALFRVPAIVAAAADERLDRLNYLVEGETITLYAELAPAAARDPAVAIAAPAGCGLACGDGGSAGPDARNRRRSIAESSNPSRSRPASRLFAPMADDGGARLRRDPRRPALLRIRRRRCAPARSRPCAGDDEGAARLGRRTGRARRLPAGRRRQCAGACALSQPWPQSELYRYHYRRAPYRPPATSRIAPVV